MARAASPLRDDGSIGLPVRGSAGRSEGRAGVRAEGLDGDLVAEAFEALDVVACLAAHAAVEPAPPPGGRPIAGIHSCS